MRIRLSSAASSRTLDLPCSCLMKKWILIQMFARAMSISARPCHQALASQVAKPTRPTHQPATVSQYRQKPARTYRFESKFSRILRTTHLCVEVQYFLALLIVGIAVGDAFSVSPEEVPA